MEQEKSLIPEEQINQPEVLENNETIVTEKPEEQASVETVTEKKEIPNIDFSLLTTAEIVTQFQVLLAAFSLCLNL